MMEPADKRADELQEGVRQGASAPAREAMYLVISVGRRRYALDAALVREVLCRRPPALFPAAGASVCGAVFYRGTCVTVFDLGWILTGRSLETPASSRIVVLKDPAWASVLVDGVAGLVRDRARGAAVPDRLSLRDAHFVTGSIEWNQDTVAVVDVAAVVRAEQAGVQRDGNNPGRRNPPEEAMAERMPK